MQFIRSKVRTFRSHFNMSVKYYEGRTIRVLAKRVWELDIYEEDEFRARARFRHLSPWIQYGIFMQAILRSLGTVRKEFFRRIDAFLWSGPLPGSQCIMVSPARFSLVSQVFRRHSKDLLRAGRSGARHYIDYRDII